MIVIAFAILFYNTLSNINEEKLDSFYNIVINDKIQYSRSVISRTIQGIETERDIVKAQQVKNVGEILELLRVYIDSYGDSDLHEDELIKSYLRNRQYCNVVLLKNGKTFFDYCIDDEYEKIDDEDYIIVRKNWTQGNDKYNSFVFVNKKVIDDIVIERLTKRIRNTVLIGNEKIYVSKIHRIDDAVASLEILVHPTNLKKEKDIIAFDEIDEKMELFNQDNLEEILENRELVHEVNIKGHLDEHEDHVYVVSGIYENYNWILSVPFRADEIEKKIDIERKSLNIKRGKEIVLFSAIIVAAIGMIYVIYSIIELRDKVKNENKKLIEAGKSIGNELVAMRDKANLDPLTNLYNRRAIEEKFMSFMRRNQFVDYSVLMCDIDDFKDINDSYGHDFGDYVLRKVADTISNTLRKEDVVSRWGGDEFLVVLFDSEINTSLIVGEKIKKAIEGLLIENNGVSLKITISIGIAKSYSGLKYQEVISLADVALYKSKNAGKNCIKFIDE